MFIARCSLGTAILFLTVAIAAAQDAGPAPLTIRTAVGPQPLAGVAVVVQNTAGASQPVTATTDAAGMVRAMVKPGNYRLLTPNPVRAGGKSYTWLVNVPVGEEGRQVSLDERNATVLDGGPNSPPVQVAPATTEITVTAPPPHNPQAAERQSASAPPGSAEAPPTDTAQAPPTTDAGSERSTTSQATEPASPANDQETSDQEEPPRKAKRSEAPRERNRAEGVSVGIVVDASVSAWDPGRVRDALGKFLRALRPDDEYAVIAASDKSSTLQEFTTDPDLLRGALKHVHSTHKVALYDTLVAAADYVETNGFNDRKVLLLLSSGNDRVSHATLDDAIATIRRRPNLPVYAIARPGTDWRGHEVLQQLASSTGGIAYIPNKGPEFVDTAQDAAHRIVGESPVARTSKTEDDDKNEKKKAKERDRKPLAGYETLIVRNIPVVKNDDTAEFQGGDNLLLQKVLVSRLQAARLFPQVEDATDRTGTDVRGTADAAANKKLELRGSIIGYSRGSRAKRGTIGMFGAGATRLKVQFVFRDLGTGEPVLSVTKEGSGGGGMLSSGDDTETKAILQVVDRLLDDIKHNR